ncbi:TonB-dependent receptor [Undibacterium amnicola]|uniref:TonB-dependent receptor n=1 Tax=Undibacterium amnicola TaxID=1834038 RepID=A0ABR6XKK4_9BURK|nr:TonB-dependent receptor [Undibacterium amnicola]MBC3829926.1 TonB-dependent receptor [Undibacterium amnicola]
MKNTLRPAVIACAIAATFPYLSSSAFANVLAKQKDDQPEHKTNIERVFIKGDRPTTLPTEIPTTIEGISAKAIEKTINAIDAEDALKYLSSLLVRKRYVGDYNHAVLATRASGTGNSARSMVYADGILLSNLLGNGATFTPRWGLVTPEEIQRVDVLYGPFSAAYSGNSVGAVVDYVTRMPEKFEAHVKLVGFSENFQEYGTDKKFSGKQLSGSLGDKQGALSWWVNLNRLDSDGHPIAFANKLLSAGVTSTAGTAVTGAIPGKNPQGLDWWLVAATGQYHTIQDHAKIKLAYEITPTLRASYTFGAWRNAMNSSTESYLRDAAGNPVYSGDVNISGKKYTLNPIDITNSKSQAVDISNSKNQIEHLTHGLNLKSNTKGEWDWELAASLYDYRKDIVRAPTVAIPLANSGGAGRITDGSGTGWNTLAVKGIWRPNAEHTTEFGYQREAFQLRTRVSDTANWINGVPSKRFSAFQGDAELNSIYLQDAWRINATWKTIFGGRFEQWSAHDGAISNTTTTLAFADRDENYFSPKVAVAFRASDDLTLKASLGRAVRMPTVSELYQGTVSTQTIVNNDPNLKPEKSWTSEWSAEQSLNDGKGLLRTTFFHEDTVDAMYSQTNTLVTPNITNIQNVDKIRTNGLELAYQNSDVVLTGLDLAASVTYADSKIGKNDKFQKSVGKWQPRVPQWRANFVASYRANDKLTTTFGVRYSGRQYGSLDNSDNNAFTYFGFSSFLVTDLRVRYKLDKQWSAAIGIDNLNNKKYWAFHPYTQRSVVAELKFDY